MLLEITHRQQKALLFVFCHCLFFFCIPFRGIKTVQKECFYFERTSCFTCFSAGNPKMIIICQKCKNMFWRNQAVCDFPCAIFCQLFGLNNLYKSNYVLSLCKLFHFEMCLFQHQYIYKTMSIYLYYIYFLTSGKKYVYF